MDPTSQSTAPPTPAAAQITRITFKPAGKLYDLVSLCLRSQHREAGAAADVGSEPDANAVAARRVDVEQAAAEK